jgi:MarR family 2-MHQ and catechol resistance regulon transcriptional repressor
MKHSPTVPWRICAAIKLNGATTGSKPCRLWIKIGQSPYPGIGVPRAGHRLRDRILLIITEHYLCLAPVNKRALLFHLFNVGKYLDIKVFYLDIKGFLVLNGTMAGNGSKKNMKTPRGADTWLVIRKASYWLQRQGLDSIAATGLGLGDFAVLKLLLFSGPLPVNVIGGKVLLTSGSITASIDRLEARGFVKRNRHPTDGRTFLVALTPQGRDKIGPASREHAKRMAEIVSVLTAGEQHELVRLMKKLGKHAMVSREKRAVGRPAGRRGAAAGQAAVQ